jgi:hypothetical protein
LTVQHILRTKQIVSIPISWNNPTLVESNTESQVLNVNDEKIKSIHSFQNRINCPARRNPDFFMDLKDKSLHNSNQIKVIGNSLQIYHQNIRSLRTKIHEFLSQLYPELPHVIFLTEHHLNIVEKKLC